MLFRFYREQAGNFKQGSPLWDAISWLFYTSRGEQSVITVIDRLYCTLIVNDVVLGTVC